MLLRRVVLGVLLLAGVVSAATPLPADAILDHIKFLASDELKGRGNGDEGLERAAEYIADQFEAAGLQPGGVNGTWFQPFELVAGLVAGDGNELVIQSGREAVRLRLGVSYFPLAATASESVAAPSASLDDLPLVFAGYGISSAAHRYDDYAGLDVKGKAVLIFSHEPQERRRDSRLNGTRPLRETTLASKAAAARSRGARALLVVSDPTHETDQANYRVFAVAADAEDHGIPVLRLRLDEMRPLLERWGLYEAAAQIEADLVPRSRPLDDATVDYVEHLSTRRRTVRNVVGILPGASPVKRDEAIVIGGHYDHVGLGGRYSSAPDLAGAIHNGADDNASGIAALIEMARAAAAEPSRFERSLVFVAFAGEERGLLGSVHYTAAPAMPLDRTVAMLNLDMVGRANGQVEVGGLDRAPSLEAELEAAADAVGGIRFRRGGPGAGRSDDASFLHKRIPALHFFTGFHDEYHHPEDDWPRIDAAGTAQVGALALELAARLGAREDRPAFVGR